MDGRECHNGLERLMHLRNGTSVITGGQDNGGVGAEGIIGNASVKSYFYPKDGKVNMEFFIRTVRQIESGLVLFVLV